MSRKRANATPVDNRPDMPQPIGVIDLPFGTQQVEEFIMKYKDADPYALRKETIRRIANETGIPLICYVTKTSSLYDTPGAVAAIEDSDLEGFDTLIDSIKLHTNSTKIDILFVSNGGSAEAAERIVRLLRENFQEIRFILPGNAYSAATMMAFACDSILMTDTATLGPIDPQINGIPARTILRGFEDLERRLREEGPESLAAYIHLLNGYSLHLLEVCKSAEDLSKELARIWLSDYMLKCDLNDARVNKIVDFFANYDVHKSHARSIGRQQSIDLGLNVQRLERGEKLTNLIKSLYDQYVFFFRVTPFIKVYENMYNTNWGRQWPGPDRLSPKE
jgi:hypothetical protein